MATVGIGRALLAAAATVVLNSGVNSKALAQQPAEKEQATPAQASPQTNSTEAPAAATKASEPASTTELPQVEVLQPQHNKPLPAAKPRKKTADVTAAKAVPAAQAAPQVVSPDDVEAGERKGQETNSSAGAFNRIKDYVAEGSGVGTKTGTPLKEIPQSVSVVGKEQMRDQGVQNINEAVRYTPGIIADGAGLDSRGDFSYLRGLAAAYFVDGLRTTFGYFNSTAPIEPYALQRVEVLRGPGSMLYGQTPTGGLINAVSKLPSDVAYNEIGFEYGSFDFKQLKFDSTGPLTTDGKWLYRVVGLARDSETQVNYVDNDRLMLAPSITYRPTSDTSITALFSVRDDHGGSVQQFLPQVGTLTPTLSGRRIPRDTFVGEPEDRYDTEQQSATILINHRFNEDLSLRHASRYTHTYVGYDTEYVASLTPTRAAFINQLFGTQVVDPAFTPYLNPDQTEVFRAYGNQLNDAKIFNTDTSLTGTILTGPLAHKVTGGIDYMRFAYDQATTGTLIDNLLTTTTVGVPIQPVFDIFNPVYGQSGALLGLDGSFTTRSTAPLYDHSQVQQQTGIYIQDELKLGRWGAVLGLRQDWLNTTDSSSPDQNERATTGRAALLYNFDFGLTPYVSYATSFSPLPGQFVGDNIFTPFQDTTPAEAIKGEQVEIGLKYQPAGGSFIINAAIYDLTERNQITSPDVLFTAVQGQDVNVRGFEIEAVGKVTKEIKVAASYSYTDATYAKYPELFPFPSGISEALEGKQVDAIPRHSAALFAIYTVDNGLLKGLSFGGGVRFVGSSESFGREIATGTDIKVTNPSYALFDAVIAYDAGDWRWQIAGQNLEDQYYTVSCTAFRGDCFIGQARTITTGFTYRF